MYKIPSGSIYHIAGLSKLNSFFLRVVLDLVAVLIATDETFKLFIRDFIVIVHVSFTLKTTRNTSSGFLHVLQIFIDGRDETT